MTEGLWVPPVPQAPASCTRGRGQGLSQEGLRGQTAPAVGPGPRNEASLRPLGPQLASSVAIPPRPPVFPQGTLPPSGKILPVSLLTWSLSAARQDQNLCDKRKHWAVLPVIYLKMSFKDP